MKTWSFRRLDTGAFIDRLYTGPRDGLAINTPEGCEAVPGDHRPPPPAPDARVAARREAMEQISALEMQQLRPLREILVDPSNQTARNRLAEIETRIAELRATLRAD